MQRDQPCTLAGRSVFGTQCYFFMYVCVQNIAERKPWPAGVYACICM